MKIQIELGSGFNKVVSDLKAAGGKIKDACSRGLAKGVKFASNKVISEHLTGQDLATRSGNLKRAVDGWMAGELDGVVGVHDQSAVDKYKWLLGTEQYTITPKKSKFLAIPIAEGLTPSGVARYGSPREVNDGFFFKGKSGGLFFGVQSGKTKRSKINVLFTFVKSVTITGSGALAAGVLESADNITESISD
ncbi:MAG: hypothetical protein WC454_09700, partial [Phycisphaerae bacterium]